MVWEAANVHDLGYDAPTYGRAQPGHGEEGVGNSPHAAGNLSIEPFEEPLRVMDMEP